MHTAMIITTITNFVTTRRCQDYLHSTKFVRIAMERYLRLRLSVCHMPVLS